MKLINTLKKCIQIVKINQLNVNTKTWAVTKENTSYKTVQSPDAKHHSCSYFRWDPYDVKEIRIQLNWSLVSLHKLLGRGSLYYGPHGLHQYLCVDTFCKRGRLCFGEGSKGYPFQPDILGLVPMWKLQNNKATFLMHKPQRWHVQISFHSQENS